MPEKNETTETLIEGELVLYDRPGSNTLQCRFKIDDKWYRRTTNHTDRDKARTAAYELFYENKGMAKSGVPIASKTFKVFADLAIERMNDEIAGGRGLSVYKEHIGTIKNYLIPVLGRKKIASIDKSALEELDAYRIEKMGKRPKKSTIQSHNAALGRVFTEAINRGHMKESDRPKLSVEGSKGERRQDFSLEEYRILVPKLREWAEKKGIRKTTTYRRLLVSDYVQIILATGARPGLELATLQWKHVHLHYEATDIKQPARNHRNPDHQAKKFRRTTVLEVTHRKSKRSTETRWLVGNDAVYFALQRIAQRNYPEIWANNDYGVVFKLQEFLRSNDVASDFIFRMPNENNHADPDNLAKNWRRFLDSNGLRYCPKTGHARTLYSLRHTYVTLGLVHNGTDIHTLARQIGSSVEMIEKHYSHVVPYLARAQLYDDGLVAALEKLSPPMEQDPNEPPDEEYF